MARNSRRQHVPALILLASLALADAQTLTNLPTLTTGTKSAVKTGKDGTTDTASSTSTFVLTGASTQRVSHLTGLPTLAGVGVPTLVIPYTANAPYMQKSSLPEGTFFIAVGATLAFLGACVLVWRAIIAWSMNLSVKRAAKMNLGATSEKSSGFSAWGANARKASAYYSVSKGALYKSGHGYHGSSVSMENLTAGGARQTRHSYRDSMTERSSSAAPPPQDLFFSPTAQPRDSSIIHQHRSSSYMPSGFYANSAAQPAGGTNNTTIGGPMSPYAAQHTRSSTHATQISRPSPPVSPERTSRGNTASRGVSQDGPLHSREGSRNAPPPVSRDSQRHSQFYAGASTSSLMVGQSSVGSESDLNSSRVQSAYLDDDDRYEYGGRNRY